MAEQRKFYGQEEFAKGLEGVIACESKIGYIDGQKGWLIYRGIEIGDLAEHSTYEETAYLLLFGKLPTRKELDEFNKKLVSYRKIDPRVAEIIRDMPPKAHPMALLRTAFSALGTYEDPEKVDEFDLDTWTDLGIKAISEMATVAAEVGRLRAGQPPVEPDPELNHASNFFYMLTGRKPNELEADVMNKALILHADHGMNASTFTSMVVASSLSDIYSAVTAGIASLKGPLHGGANERTLKMFMEIGEPENARAYIEDKLAKKVKIMGMGHRVYKAYDPRARILSAYAEKLAKLSGNEKLYIIAKEVEKVMIERLGQKGIFPNVDFYSGIVYYSLGIDPKMFTPIFAVARVAGWVARVLEYLHSNRIFRPRAVYTGPLKAEYIPIDQRS
jgi:citrate synthase